jgi:hypothetical protein
MRASSFGADKQKHSGSFTHKETRLTESLNKSINQSVFKPGSSTFKKNNMNQSIEIKMVSDEEKDNILNNTLQDMNGSLNRSTNLGIFKETVDKEKVNR